MELYVSCECGWSTVAVQDDLIASVREHAVSVHGIDLSDEQILAAARPYLADARPTEGSAG